MISRLKSALKTILPPPMRGLLIRSCRIARFWRKRRPYPNDYSYQSLFMHHVPEHGIILDIASGHNPFPKATILSDRFLERTAHRREELVLDHRPFVILDIQHLPFADKSVDYIYCSHVIEHIDDPLRACAEMTRVGKAGYVEAPTMMKDALFSWARDMNHKWNVVRTGDRLVFFEYDARRQEGVRSSYWANAVMSEQFHPLQDLFYPNQDLFNTYIEWIDNFEVTIFRLDTDEPVHSDFKAGDSVCGS